jgi:hydroxymethylpyrimidine/phosphomethylpyrimidine kinase
MNLNQVTLPCTDYEASVAFYRRLGFTQIVASPPRYARFECESGATFSLHLVPDARPPTSGIVVYFEVGDLDATVADLESKGIELDSDPVDQRWLWREASLKDPAGNRLCLYGENRRFPPWRIA